MARQYISRGISITLEANIKKFLKPMQRATKSLAQFSKRSRAFRFDMLSTGFVFAMIGRQINNLFSEQQALIGISQRMADVVGAPLGNAVASTNAKFHEFAMETLSLLAPVIESALGFLQQLMDILHNILKIPFIKELAGWLVIFGPIISALAFLVTGMNAWSLVIIAVAALAAWLITNWDKVAAFFVNLWNTITSAFWGAVNFIWKVISGAIGFIGNLWVGFWQGAKDFLVGIWNGIITVIEMGVNGVIGFINTLIGAWNSVMEPLGFGIGKLGKADLGGWRIPTGKAGGGDGAGTNIQVNVETGPVSNEIDMDALAKRIGDEVANSVRQEVKLV